MTKTTRICRICGKEYEYCLTLRRSPNIFRWQDVACCEEHGTQYFHDIMVSRGEIVDDTKTEDVQDEPAVEVSNTTAQKSVRKKSE